MTAPQSEPKVALITGAARRIGERLARGLHARGYRVVVHYHRGAARAERISADLNRLRADSARAFAADLSDLADVQRLAEQALQAWGHVDVLINNAGSYYPTPWGQATAAEWQDLIGSNLMGPFFLTQALLDALVARRGCVVNLIDIFAERPARDLPIYGMAKAGLAHMTRSLAFDLRGKIRVNGIAPGVILWPERPTTDAEQAAMLRRIPLERIGDPADIVKTALFLIEDAPYVNGQIINVDGGLSLNT